MRKFNFLFVSFVLLCMVACQSQKSEVGDSSIHIDWDNTSLGDFDIENVEYIPLETTDNSLLGSVSKILFRNNRIYVLDKMSGGVYVFDKTGKFLSSIIKPGEGPDEYVELMDMDVDKEGNVYIADNDMVEELELTDAYSSLIDANTLKILLNKKSSFKDGINKLIQLRTLLINEWKNAMKDLSIEDYSKQPFINKDGYESKTIAYSIYHVFRIEDIVLNTLIKNKEQVFLRDDYQNKMNLSIITTGNELMRENISEFSKTLIIEELWKYAKNVFEESNEWLSSIDYEDLKIVFSELDKERIKNTNAVAKSENWLIEYWCSKNIKGLLGMPFSRHWIMHLEATLRIRNKLK